MKVARRSVVWTFALNLIDFSFMRHMGFRDLRYAQWPQNEQTTKKASTRQAAKRRRRGGHHTLDVRFWAAALASITICCQMSSEIKGTYKTRRNDAEQFVSNWGKLGNWQSDSTPAIKHFEYLGTEINGRKNVWNSVSCSGKISGNFVAQTYQSGATRQPISRYSGDVD